MAHSAGARAVPDAPCARRYARAFTLVELLVVLAIIGLLASIVAPNVLGRMGGAKVKTARVQMADLGAAVDMYALDVGSYPTTEQGLAALLEAPDGTTGWSGPYLKKRAIPLDPWNHPYQYSSPGQHGEFEILCLGADGLTGGEGDAADISSSQ